MSKRAHIPLKAKLASALLQMRSDDGAYLIEYEHAKLLSAEQVISLFQFDHGILHSTAPIDEPWNLTPRLIPEHRAKSKRDTKVAAKLKRLRGETCTGPRQKIARRADGGWPAKGTRKLQSKGFERRP